MFRSSKTSLIGLVGLLAPVLYVGVLYVPLAKAQVWVDESQLGGRTPEWVDHQYYHPPEHPTPPRQIWCEPLYRTVLHRVWREPVYTTTVDRVWVEGHNEIHRTTTYDPCGCPIVHDEHVWVPGHYTSVERRVCIRPGRWEEVPVRELVSAGHWEEVHVEVRH